MHLTPAGFPAGMPAIGLEIEGAMQQAPHFDRQGRFILIASIWAEFQSGADLVTSVRDCADPAVAAALRNA